MRVLIVNPAIYVYGGAELVIVKLANYLSQKKIENAILTTAILPEVKKDLKNTAVLIQKRRKNKLFDFFGIAEIVALHEGVRENLSKYDVINAHNYPAELSVFPYCKPTVWLCNEPPVVHLGLEFEPLSISKLGKKTLLVADRFIVKNYIQKVVVADEFNAARFEKLYGFKPEIVPYGIEYEFFSKSDVNTTDVFCADDNFVVLHVGMVTPYKNQLESVKAVEQLKDRIPNIKLILAGWLKGRYGQMVQRYVKERELDRYVVFTDHIDRIQLRKLYQSCNVLLHPVKSQGGWLSPFEALCAKKIIVVSPQAPVASIIASESIGIVTDKFADAILDVYNNPDKYNEYATKGEKWVSQNLTWDKFCERLLSLFYDVYSAKK